MRDRSGRQDGRTAAWSGKGVVGNLGAGQMADHGAQLEASNLYTLQQGKSSRNLTHVFKIFLTF